MFDAGPATLGSFVSNVQNLRDKNIMGSFYSGGGPEGHNGPLGLRLEVADEIYFNAGTHISVHRLLLISVLRSVASLLGHGPACEASQAGLLVFSALLGAAIFWHGGTRAAFDSGVFNRLPHRRTGRSDRCQKRSSGSAP